jgi:hypothetical protein
MAISFQQLNEGLIGALLDSRELIERRSVLAKQTARMEQEGGHLLRLLPVNFVFDERDCAVLAAAASALLGAQTKILRHLADSIGREGILQRFRVPDAMRRFVSWDELLDPQWLVARIDILQSRDGYRFCELNVDSCVAAAEIFEFASDYFHELGVSVHELGVTPPLQDLGHLLAQAARRLDAARVVILDWSVGGGSAGKGYLSFERMRAHVARAVSPMPVFIADEKTFDAEWLTPGEAKRTLVFRGFMMDEMDDDGAFLDRLLALGTPVISTYETEIRMNKLWFALFHDESLLSCLTADEREIIARYVPITREVDARNRDALIEHRHRYVFKEKQSFGGQGIYFGESTPAEELREILAGDAAGRWTAQEVLDTVPAELPHDERFENESHHLVLGLYLYGTRANGMFVRASKGSKVVNVTVGNAKVAWAFCISEAGRAALLAGLQEGIGVGA